MSTEERENRSSYYSAIDIENLDFSHLNEKSFNQNRESVLSYKSDLLDVANIDECNLRKKSMNAEEHHERLISFEHDFGNSILKSWQKKEDEERESRKLLTFSLVIILGFQLILLNIIIIQLGAGNLEFSDSTVKSFITGTFVEITGLLAIIFTYLFKERGVKTLEIALKITDNINKHNSNYFPHQSSEGNAEKNNTVE